MCYLRYRYFLGEALAGSEIEPAITTIRVSRYDIGHISGELIISQSNAA